MEVILIKPPEEKMPDWPLVHQLSSDRHRYCETLSVNIVLQAVAKAVPDLPKVAVAIELAKKQKTREN